jgi:hypothetical protein
VSPHPSATRTATQGPAAGKGDGGRAASFPYGVVFGVIAAVFVAVIAGWCILKAVLRHVNKVKELTETFMLEEDNQQELVI